MCEYGGGTFLMLGADGKKRMGKKLLKIGWV